MAWFTCWWSSNIDSTITFVSGRSLAVVPSGPHFHSGRSLKSTSSFATEFVRTYGPLPYMPVCSARGSVLTAASPAGQTMLVHGSSGATNDGLGMGASSLAFTTTTREMPIRYLESTDNDWRSLNYRFGPQGGATEVALSTVPAGDAGRKRGLFIRQQIPPDPEPSRGGMERLLS